MRRKETFTSMIFGKICYVAWVINRAGKLICLHACLYKRDCAGLIEKPGNGIPSIGKFQLCCISVSIDFPSNSQWDAPFHCIAYNSSHADWDGFHDHLRDVPWKDIFKLSASAAASGFCEWVHVAIVVYIPHRKYQVKFH